MPNRKKKVGVKRAKKSKPVEVVDPVQQEYLENLKCVDLINIIRKNKDEAKVNRAFEKLLSKLMPKIQKLISKFNIPGCDHSDVLQEALYALRYKAIKDYDKARGTGEGPAPFDKFALLCIRRHLATEFKSSYQNKKRVLNQSVSINKESFNPNGNNDEDLSLANIISDPDAEDLMTEIGDAEYYRNLQTLLLNSLSDFEKEVYLLYAQRYSYEEIAEKINDRRSKVRVNIKGVDNALSRIKTKAKEILEEYESNENHDPKSVDNALQRIKSKAKKVIDEYETDEGANDEV
jgi:RNA polymerase sigma factor (sigma-70 family)